MSNDIGFEAMKSRAQQALSKLLESKRFTQEALSKLTGISQSHLSRLASGERVEPNIQHSLALKREAGIELEWWNAPPELDAPDSEPKPTEAA